MRHLNKALLADIDAYISAHYIQHEVILTEANVAESATPSCGALPMMPKSASAPALMPCAAPSDLERELDSLDESFQEALLRLIDERGMKDSACYKRAGIDRKHFSKIRSNRLYKPKKSTAIAFAIALELTLDEAKDLLLKAGYALSRSAKADVIVEYFILNGRYDLRELNEVLYEYDQPLI